MWKVDRKIERVETEERRRSLLSPSPSLFLTIISISLIFWGAT